MIKLDCYIEDNIDALYNSGKLKTNIHQIRNRKS